MLLRRFRFVWLAIALASLIAAGCQPAQAPAAGQATATSPSAGATSTGLPRVLATETFLADIAQNVAGTRLKVDALLPVGVDAHEFEPAPGDVTRVAQSNVVIANGAGFEGFLDKLLQNAGGQHELIIASTGLTSRTPREGESVELGQPADAHATSDPHFWLDPTKTITYVTNIRDGLSKADPAGAATYAANADAYIKQLHDLDTWMADQVGQVPADRRLLVTNHESLGYFADRYGFHVVGTVIPSVSSEASPSAQQLARLIDQVRTSHAPAIFLETGTNAQLARQVAQETGAKVVTDLYTHSITAPGGPAPTYIDMLKYDTQIIVTALK